MAPGGRGQEAAPIVKQAMRKPLTWHGKWAGPLNLHLSLLIILLLVCTAVPLVWLSYMRGRDAAIDAALGRMQLLTERTVDRYGIVFNNVVPVVTMASVSETFASPPPAALMQKQQMSIEALKS